MDDPPSSWPCLCQLLPTSTSFVVVNYVLVCLVVAMVVVLGWSPIFQISHFPRHSSLVHDDKHSPCTSAEGLTTATSATSSAHTPPGRRPRKSLLAIFLFHFFRISKFTTTWKIIIRVECVVPSPLFESVNRSNSSRKEIYGVLVIHNFAIFAKNLVLRGVVT